MGEQRLYAASTPFEPGLTARSKGPVSGKLFCGETVADVLELCSGQVRPVERDLQRKVPGSANIPVQRAGRNIDSWNTLNNPTAEESNGNELIAPAGPSEMSCEGARIENSAVRTDSTRHCYAQR